MAKVHYYNVAQIITMWDEGIILQGTTLTRKSDGEVFIVSSVGDYCIYADNESMGLSTLRHSDRDLYSVS